MGTVLLVLLGIVLAAAVLLVALPVEVTVEAATSPSPGVRGKVRVLGGHAPAIPIDREAGKSDKVPQDTSGKTRKRKRGPVGRGARIARALPQLVFGLLSRIRFHKLEIDGLGDLGTFGRPCRRANRTGLRALLIAPFAYALPHAQTRIDRIRPDFAQDNRGWRAALLRCERVPRHPGRAKFKCTCCHRLNDRAMHKWTQPGIERCITLPDLAGRHCGAADDDFARGSPPGRDVV